MVDQSSQLAGQIDTSLTVNALAAALTRQGVRVRVQESCHYASGTYIRVCEGAPDFTLERVEGEFLAEAVALSIQQMQSVAACVSTTLAALEIRHRFEIYAAQSEMVDYLHWNWPVQN